MGACEHVYVFLMCQHGRVAVRVVVREDEAIVCKGRPPPPPEDPRRESDVYVALNPSALGMVVHVQLQAARTLEDVQAQRARLEWDMESEEWEWKQGESLQDRKVMF